MSSIRDRFRSELPAFEGGLDTDTSDNGPAQHKQYRELSDGSLVAVAVKEPELLTDTQLAENFEIFKKELSFDRTTPQQKAFWAMVEVYGDDLDRYSKENKLGFKETPHMKKLAEVVSWFDTAGREAEDREYYLIHYPGYKYFTDKELHNICDKYNLIWGDVGHYIGEIPEQCVEEMTALIVKEEDQTSQQTMQIIAPQEKFNISQQHHVVDHKIVAIPKEDPLALVPVRGGYLLASAWGEESYLEEVVNPQRN